MDRLRASRLLRAGATWRTDAVLLAVLTGLVATAYVAVAAPLYNRTNTIDPRATIAAPAVTRRRDPTDTLLRDRE